MIIFVPGSYHLCMHMDMLVVNKSFEKKQNRIKGIIKSSLCSLFIFFNGVYFLYKSLRRYVFKKMAAINIVVSKAY